MRRTFKSKKREDGPHQPSGLSGTTAVSKAHADSPSLCYTCIAVELAEMNKELLQIRTKTTEKSETEGEAERDLQRELESITSYNKYLCLPKKKKSPRGKGGGGGRQPPPAKRARFVPFRFRLRRWSLLLQAHSKATSFPSGFLLHRQPPTTNNKHQRLVRTI